MLHEFYRDKKILITGHTGFKGSWLSLWLHNMGAKVYGVALDPISSSDHFVVTGLADKVAHTILDIRDLATLKATFNAIQPELIFHLAAQPIVLESYADPIKTLETNIMGTANVLEAARGVSALKSVVVITTDKCYENREIDHAYTESDPLGGYDPYSSSKAAAELVSQSYARSYFDEVNVGLATARAGNVIGGGDWQQNRLIPDLMRALQSGQSMHIRNPDSVRPWQHVLEPLYGYLLLGRSLTLDATRFKGAWNFGPDRTASVTVQKVMNLAARRLPALPIQYGSDSKNGHEAGLLMLDSKKATTQLGWHTRLNLDETVDYTIEWYEELFKGGKMDALSCQQIQRYEERLQSA